ncbi:MAG: nuclear transport factor 2 family protein [Pseudomonadota bacterium]
MATKDSKHLVHEAFRSWENGDSGPFFDLIADDVVWTVIGTTQVSGVYHSKQELIDKAFGPLLTRLDGKLTTTFVDLACEGEKIFLRFKSTGVTKSGIRYDQCYCWAMVMRDSRITEIVAYLDTDLLRRVFEESHSLK